MPHRRTWRAALVTLVALAAACCVTAPATAGAGTSTDPQKDVEYVVGASQAVSYGGNGLDIYSTHLRYADGKLVVRTTFHNLTRCNTEWLDRCRPWRPLQYVYLDTMPDPADELYQEEYYAFHLDHHAGLSDNSGERRCPGLRWRSDLHRETSTFVVPRSCLRPADRDRVRVRVTASDEGRHHPRTHSFDLVTDTLDWTPWVSYG